MTKYVYGLGLIGEERNGYIQVYHYDYRGSTVAVTNECGEITDTFEYDTYGNVTGHIGSTFVIFGYNGRDGVITDNNGLVYMRARYYSPEMKRFINADIIPGEISNAITLNRYAYANGNPVSNVDPFGLSVDSSRTGKIRDSMHSIFSNVTSVNQFSDAYIEFLKYLASANLLSVSASDEIEFEMGNFTVTFTNEVQLGDGKHNLDINKLIEQLENPDIKYTKSFGPFELVLNAPSPRKPGSLEASMGLSKVINIGENITVEISGKYGVDATMGSAKQSGEFGWQVTYQDSYNNSLSHGIVIKYESDLDSPTLPLHAEHSPITVNVPEFVPSESNASNANRNHEYGMTKPGNISPVPIIFLPRGSGSKTSGFGMSSPGVGITSPSFGFNNAGGSWINNLEPIPSFIN